MNAISSSGDPLTRKIVVTAAIARIVKTLIIGCFAVQLFIMFAQHMRGVLFLGSIVSASGFSR